MDKKKVNMGIGLFKINYDMDLVGQSQNADRPQYTAGVLAHTNDEAVETLRQFCVKNVQGFKGFRINQIGFDGLCHAISKDVEEKIIGGAINRGIVKKVDKVEEKKTTTPKKVQKKVSILKKEEKE